MKTAADYGLIFSKAQPLVQHALEFATHAHAGQERKYTGDPYIVHPIEVAQIVYSVFPDVNMICAALLHDTIEDCSVTHQQLCDEGFNWCIADLVRWLSDVAKPEDGNRATRMEINRAHTVLAPPDAKTIKLADLISNSRTIQDFGGKFADIYMGEKRLLLDVLKQGNPKLLAEATRIVDEYDLMYRKHPL